MKRFILSVFSVVLAAGAVAPNAAAFPQLDADFKIQSLRLREFDARNKSEEAQAPYYPYTQAPEQTSEWTTPQTVTSEQKPAIEAEAKVPTAEATEAVSDRPLSVLERRRQVLDRS